MNTNLLREHLKTVIESKCSNVSYGEYDPDMDTQYAVFKIDDVDVADKEYKQIEINIYNTNVEELENVADSIASQFKNYKFINENFLIFTKINSKNPVDDDRNVIKRRRLLIDLYFYDRSVD